MVLSGFGFPISRMPKVLQWFIYIDPLRYFLVIIRSTFHGIGVLWPELAALCDSVGNVLMEGREISRPAARYRAERALFLLFLATCKRE